LKHYSFLIACVALLLGAGSAHAATVNLNGSDDTLGTVTIGQTGTIDNLVTFPLGGGNTAYLLGAAFGELPADSEIIFSYTFLNGVGSHGNLRSTATYGQTIGNKTYSAFSSSTGNGDYSYFVTAAHPHHHIPTPSPVLATAHMGHHDRHGMTTITNTSDVDVSFSSYFISFFQRLFHNGRGLGDVIVTYDVVSTAALPLPGALPLFGVGLLSLTSIGLWKKTRRKYQRTR
jgi:hypothetical protein